MECLRGKSASSPKTATVVFFTVGKSLVVISSVHRMIVVILNIVNPYPLR